ncbi:stage V sporulation protein AB [Lottiidibacillus patelloidae]|uniref:Stage V sporulation protein AB n=1 Tax=Lottiidibacillus patelloidae TaxID=2670334 RepID=A0A263BU96_9BACI|nr:stage V sporulation protein AB [Lottiidibacillus patelloidae]OZM57138.1 stage V sporulation protein AB [Lottiidibacillus patelloidae]
MMPIEILLLLVIGFSGGIAVGAGFVAFLTVLGIIPRLTQLTRTKKYIRFYEVAIILGSMISAWLSLRDHTLEIPSFSLIILGLFFGVFVGMLAAALTEVLNVLPILAKRIGVHEKIVYLLMAIVFGKMIGSLFHWLFYVYL